MSRTIASTWPPYEDYDRWRASARDTKGRVLKGNSKPFTPPQLPEGVINLSDPDARVMRTQGTPPRQAYNAQTSVNEQQVIPRRGDHDRRR